VEAFDGLLTAKNKKKGSYGGILVAKKRDPGSASKKEKRLAQIEKRSCEGEVKAVLSIFASRADAAREQESTRTSNRNRAFAARGSQREATEYRDEEKGGSRRKVRAHQSNNHPEERTRIPKPEGRRRRSGKSRD